MSILMLAPIVIVLGLILGLVILITKTNKKSSEKTRKKILSGHRVRVVFGGYIALLIICTLWMLFVPMKGWGGHLKTSDSEQLNDINRMYEAASRGDVDTLNERYFVKKWKFGSPSNHKLNLYANTFDPKQMLTSNQDNYLESQVFIERKDSNDDQIEAFYYRSESSVDSISITPLMKPIKMKLEGDTLMISNPEKVDLTFSAFQTVFTVAQFTGGSSLFNHESSSSMGMSILYLRIPKNLTIGEQSQINIEKVE